MGAICAVVYLLCVIMFIPFPFYRDIVAATSGGGNRDLVIESQQVETGRLLHKFPHNKVSFSLCFHSDSVACVLPFCNFVAAGRCALGHWR
jgi:hypothetical protein